MFALNYDKLLDQHKSIQLNIYDILPPSLFIGVVYKKVTKKYCPEIYSLYSFSFDVLEL